MIYSVYSALLFGQICAPSDKEDEDQRWNPTDEITCRNTTQIQYPFMKHLPSHTCVAAVAWTMLVTFVAVYMIKEVTKMFINIRKYVRSMDSYRNLVIVISIVLVIYRGHPEDPELKLQRWQYHVASYTCFLLWIEMLFLVGKLPRFGKYVQMFW